MNHSKKFSLIMCVAQFFSFFFNIKFLFEFATITYFSIKHNFSQTTTTNSFSQTTSKNKSIMITITIFQNVQYYMFFLINFNNIIIVFKSFTFIYFITHMSRAFEYIQTLKLIIEILNSNFFQNRQQRRFSRQQRIDLFKHFQC